MTRATADLLLLAAALIWGLAFVGQATAMEHMGPLTFSGARFLLAALVVAPFAAMESRRMPAIPRNRAPALIGIGTVFFLGVVTQQLGLLSTSVTNAGFLTALYVIMVPALAWAVQHVATRRAAARMPMLASPVPASPLAETPVKVNGFVWPAAAISFAGTFLLGGGRIGGLNWGDGLVIVAAFFWAVQILALGALAYDLRRPLTIAFIQYAVTAALGLGAGFIFETPTLAGVFAAWRELAYTGVVSGGIAFTLQSIAQAHTPPSDAAIIVSSESLFAAAFGALLLGDRLGAAGWSGAALVLAAVLLVQLGPAYLRR
ncbi:MAG TPA: DMT family transporter [Parvibaculum sp.]|jgi:drug/metabolite transporter (DMT)-like permease